MIPDAALLAWLVPSGLGALVLAALALAADRALGTRRPEIAAGLWWASLVRLALPPDIGSPVGLSVAIVSETAAIGGEIATPIWIGGALLAAAMCATRLVRERRSWARCARSAPRAATRRVVERCAERLGLRRVPAVFAVDRGAACVGVLDPWIAIPRELEGSSRRRDLEVVMLHELAHLRRRDGLRRALVLALQCVFWFHPAAWLAGRRLGALAEIECDRLAASAARGGADSCRRTLLDQARSWVAPDATTARAFVPPRSVLLLRLRALDRGPRRRRRAVIALTFLLSLASIGPAIRGIAIPPLDELDGCLRKRYAVFAAMAEAQDRASRE